MEIFGDIERFAADLYPYRWPITLALVVLVGGAIWIAVRNRWHLAIARHPLLSASIALPIAAVLIFGGWYTLSPLWQRTYLEEASPLEAAAMPAVVASPPAEAGDAPTTPVASVPATAPTNIPALLPRQTHTGMFVGADDFHFGRGTALLIETAPNVYSLRFEDFSVRNGPDLFVYLTPDPSGESIDGALNLGELKATDGAFNYDVPPGTDIAQFSSAIVWCRQFATLFTVAELSEI